MLPLITWRGLVAHLWSLPIGSWLWSHREHRWLNPSDRLKQPDGPVGVVSDVLATHWVGIRGLNLLSFRRLIKLLTKVVISCYKFIILAKMAEVRFVASLVCRVRDVTSPNKGIGLPSSSF